MDMMGEAIDIRLYLRNQREVQSGLERTGRAGESMGRQLESGGRRGALGFDLFRAAGNRGIAMMRTFYRWSSRIALTTGGLIAAKFLRDGIKFNATMESNTLALKRFLGGSKNAHRFLLKMFDIAKKTPFQFADLTKSSRLLLAFGLDAKTTTKTLRSFADAIAAAGGSGENVARVTRALGQVQAKGKVYMEELLQFTEAGIPAIQILKEELNLTQEEVAKIGRHGISSKKAIVALTRGLDKRFKGAAKDQQKTWDGMTSTMRDNWSQMTGAMTEGLFKEGKKWMPKINEAMTAITKIWQDKDLSVDEKIHFSKVVVQRKLGPLWEAIEAMDIPEKLGKAFSDALPHIFNILGAGAAGGFKAFLKGWWNASWEGKLVTMAFLMAKFGLYGPIGRWAAKKFIASFIPWMAARLAAASIATGPFGTAILGKAGGKWSKMGRIAGRAFGLGLALGAIAILAEDEFFKDPAGYLKKSITGHDLGDAMVPKRQRNPNYSGSVPDPRGGNRPSWHWGPGSDIGPPKPLVPPHKLKSSPQASAGMHDVTGKMNRTTPVDALTTIDGGGGGKKTSRTIIVKVGRHELTRVIDDEYEDREARK